MTECMPIATPTLDYKLDREGTSGMACGPDIAIFSDKDKQPLPPGTVGHIVISGSPVFLGYQDPAVGLRLFRLVFWLTPVKQFCIIATLHHDDAVQDNVCVCGACTLVHAV